MFEDARVSWFLASRAIRRGNKGTTAMIIVILAAVFVNMLFLPAIYGGAFQMLDQKNIDYNGYLVIHPRPDDQYIGDATDVSQKIGGIPGVTGVTQRLTVPVIITHQNRVVPHGVIGIDPLKEKTVTILNSKVVQGEFLDEADTDSIVIGRLLAGDKNKKEEDELVYSLRGVDVGDSVDLTFNNGVTKQYRIKGILDARDSAVDYNAYVNLQEIAAVTGTADEVTSINIKVAPSVSVNEFKVTLMKFGVQQRISTWREDAALLMQEAGGALIVLYSVSTVAGVFIAIVVMFIVVYINTVNKRKQIGIIKAIGIDQKIIVNSYVFQVVIFATAGILLGVVLNYLLVTLLTIYPLETSEGVMIPIIDVGSVLQAAAALFIGSIIAGFYPAWESAKLDILEAMRG